MTIMTVLFIWAMLLILLGSFFGGLSKAKRRRESYQNNVVQFKRK